MFIGGMNEAKKPKLNVRLLRKIQKHILEEPRRFFMDWFIARVNPGTKRLEACIPWTAGDLAKIPPPCGTAACIAGWANLFTGHRPYSINHARTELGLTTHQANDLFSVHGWPEPFYSRYRNADAPSKRAKIAAARIEHLIKTGK